jgi:hypothetical protein
MRALVAVGLIILVLWAVLWIGFRIVTGLVHLLLIVAVILVILGLVRRGASALGGGSRRT